MPPPRPRSFTNDDIDIDVDEHDPTSYQHPSSTNNNPVDPESTPNNNTNNTDNPLLRENPLLSPLEQDVLDEYTRLLENMNRLAESIAHLSTKPAAETLDSLRLLERKTATVCTLLKASVYSIVLQQQIYNEEDNNGGGGGEGGDGEHGHGHMS